ncbi:MAG: nucleotidyltransferase family protein [Clostridia bacterium]|nr:nucleotidyltransferase family protein [Clostridia bacterium]
MMDTFQKEFTGLIRAAFTASPAELSSDFDLKRVVDVSRKHNIAAIVFYGAVNCGLPLEDACMQELYQMTMRSIAVSFRQTHEIEQIENAFRQEGIEYMPLKGTILKGLYPKPEMRTMGDADILIKLEQYAKVGEIVTQLGFAFQYESDHELVWKKPTLYLELHKSIMTSYNRDFYSYFGTGWKIAKKVPDCSRYEMSAEDFYIFIFVHFTKHYRISGIGIKHLIDLWVYANAQPELDWTYIENELEKMNLSRFYANVRKTIDVWFHGEEATDITDLITNVIFNSGQYGTSDMAFVNRAIRNGQNSAMKIKLGEPLKKFFAPYSVMKEKYRILEKLPVLLPVMWIVRLVDFCIHKKSYLKRYVKRISRVSSKQVEENQLALHVVGLEFEDDK